MQELRNLKQTRSRVGDFGGGKIIGFQYQGDEGIGWHITTLLPSSRNSHDYWVADDIFYNITRTEVTGYRLILLIASQPAVDITSTEKQVVLEAIAEWEKSESRQDSACSDKTV
jgi:hypothetical protein